MEKTVWTRSFGSSGNLKSKTCPKLRRRIENLKWMGIFAIAFTFAFGGAEASAQQTGKIFRIGFLDSSTASGSAVLVEAFRQELSKLGWVEKKNITSSTDLPSKSLSDCLSSQRSWFV